jgi:hypothetical protein
MGKDIREDHHRNMKKITQDHYRNKEENKAGSYSIKKAGISQKIRKKIR